MRIKELQLYGFKSFPHKTIIRFSRGINAVIGPNGCGKSNVLDALRWVLGEQSFSMLRCGKNEDVVFGGTATVPPLGYAEVRLIMKNPGEDGGTRDASLPGSEVEIRRRYFRSGESEYFLNRNPCRLKDIQDVFFNTGTGTKAYSIFDLGSLRAIIAGELRPMFEEAATLAKYRERRTDCLRKLELTDADLLRLDDIIAERERIARSLKRQAYRLSAFDRLKHEEKRLRLQLLRAEYERAKENEQAARNDLLAGEAEDARLLDRVQKTEAELEAVRQELAAGREQRDRLMQELDDLRSRAALAETQATVAAAETEQYLRQFEQLGSEEERVESALVEQDTRQAEQARELAVLKGQAASVERALASQRASTAEQENRLLELRQSLARAQDESRQVLAEGIDAQQSRLTLEARQANAEDYRTRVAADLELASQRGAQLEATLAALKADLRAATAELETAQERLLAQRRELTDARAKREDLVRAASDLGRELLSSSQELAALQPALGSEQRARAQAGLGSDCLGRLTDLLVAGEGYDAAVEAVLAGMLDYFVLRAPSPDATGPAESSAPRSWQALDRTMRWGFIINHGPADAPPTELSPAGPAGEAALPLRQFVEFRPDAPAQVRNLVDNTWLANSLEQAWQLHCREPGHHYVTRDGVAVLSEGIVILESAREGRLSAARRARELEATVAGLKQTIAERESEAQATEARSKTFAQSIQDGEERILELVNRRSRLDAECAAEAGSLAGAGAEVQRQRSALSGVQRQLDELAAARRQLDDRLQEHATRSTHHQQQTAQMERAAAEFEAAVKSGLEKSAETLLELTRLREQTSSRRHELELGGPEIERGRKRRAEIQERRREVQQTSERRRSESERSRAEAAELLAARDECSARLTTIDLAGSAQREDELTRKLHAARPEQESARQLTLDLRLKALEATHRRSDLEQEAKRVFGVDLTAAPENGRAEAGSPAEATDALLPGDEEPGADDESAEPGSEPAVQLSAAGTREPVAGDATTQPIADDVDERLRLVSARLERLGRVNPLAGEEYKNEKEELDRLLTQRADVLGARDGLLKTIAEIDRFAREQFLNTFGIVRDGFREIFARLFVEGEADLILAEPGNPLESDISIVARPKGKSPRRLDQLSDGEKALLALSLLFAFYRVKPAPFCFLDEVDAPLDDANVDRFARFLKEISNKTQVVIITHNRATVEQADVLFGVTMEEPGVSKILSVRLGEVAARQAVRESTLQGVEPTA